MVFIGLPQVSILCLQVQPVEVPWPMRQHPIFCRPQNFCCGVWPVRFLQRSSRLQCKDRTETSRQSASREQHKILLRRLQQHLPCLLRQPHTDRTRVFLHGVSDFRRGRTKLFWTGGHERGDRRPGDVSVPMLLGEYQWHGGAGRSDSRTYILRTVSR